MVSGGRFHPELPISINEPQIERSGSEHKCASRAQLVDFKRDGSYSLRYGMESPHQTAERLMTPTAILIAVGPSAEPAANGGFFCCPDYRPK
jgi:hypothetical protein